MPITTGFTSRSLAQKGKGHIHTDKWHRCIQHVEAKGGGYDPYGVCTNAIGYKESINPEHRTPGPHASANTRRFKEAAKRRREAAEKMEFTQILKYNPNHSKSDGKFTSGGGGGQKMMTLPHGKVSAAHAKELGLAEGSYRNIPGVGVMGRSNEDKRTAKATSATTNAEIYGNKANKFKGSASDKAKLHKEAAKAHSEAAKEHDAVGNTEQARKHREQAAHHRKG